MINAAILDDEPRSSWLMEQKLIAYGDSINIGAVYNSPELALKEIKGHQLDVLFLDVEMPSMNAFQFLERLGEFSFEIVFTTAHNTYILDALRVSAIDYLLKPIDEDELKKAVDRLSKRIKARRDVKETRPAAGAGKQPDQQRLALPTAEGVYFVNRSTITHVEAMSNYSIFHIANSKKITVSKTLKEFEETLGDGSFLRVSRSAIVNLDFVVKYSKGEGGTLELTDGKEIEVSPSRKEMLMERLFGA
jgi:two-component system LytT family response regulator